MPKLKARQAVARPLYGQEASTLDAGRALVAVFPRSSYYMVNIESAEVGLPPLQLLSIDSQGSQA